MINILIGPPGSGKSYESVAHHVIPELKNGRKIVTNLPLNVEAIEKDIPGATELIEFKEGKLVKDPKTGEQIMRHAFSHIDDYKDEWKHPEKGFGPLYVIDECHFALPRGKSNQTVEEWFSMHRHENKDVLLMTQSYGKVSKAVIDMVQNAYKVRKLVALGTQSQYSFKVQDGVRGEVLNSKVRKYDKKYFPYYQSHTKSGSASEALANDIKPIWQHWSFILLGLLLVFIIYRVFAYGINPFSSVDDTLGSVDKKPSIASVKPSPDVLPSSLDNARPTMLNAPLSSPAASVDPIQAQEPPRVHPYYKVDLHIAGFLTFSDQGFGKARYLLSASKNGGKSFELTDRDLLDAGYTFKPINSCLAEVSYDDFFSDYIICDKPTRSLAKNMPGSF